jgi:hypothetical protein
MRDAPKYVFLCGNLVVNSDINSGFIGYKPTTMEI